MNVGIAIPCHFKDYPLLCYCLNGIENLNPQPHKVLIYINNSGIKKARTFLFNRLFQTCDVVLQCSVDFYVFPDILQYVTSSKLISFALLVRNPISNFLRIMKRLITPHPWTGCYSIPKELWFKVRRSKKWNGTDTSVKKIIGDYSFIHSPKYYGLRPSRRWQHIISEQQSTYQKLRRTVRHIPRITIFGE